MRNIGAAIGLAVLMGTGLTATPITINFAGLSAVGAGAAQAGDGTSYTQDGYIFTNNGSPNPNDIHALVTWGTLNANHPLGGNASTSLLAFYDTTPLSIAKADDSPFSIFGIDLASSNFNEINFGLSFGLTFTGHVVGGSTVTQTFTVNNNEGTPVLHTFSFNSGFTNLTSVTFQQGFLGNGNSFQFNNVVVDVTSAGAPEPSTLALLLGGGLLLTAVRFRKAA